MTFSVPSLYQKMTQIFPSFFLSKTKCLEKIQDITGSKKRGLNFMIFHEMKNLTDFHKKFGQKSFCIFIESFKHVLFV